MDRVILSPQQQAAVAAIVRWYRHDRCHQQVARIWGYAGTGKSTILRYVIEELGLSHMSRDGSATGGVLFAAFTGKAALVMTRKGTPASTIHSLIYRVSESTPEEIDRVEKELSERQRGWGRMAPAERVFAETRVRRLELRLADIHKPQFLLND